jgi:hypothetical protein
MFTIDQSLFDENAIMPFQIDPLLAIDYRGQNEAVRPSLDFGG